VGLKESRGTQGGLKRMNSEQDPDFEWISTPQAVTPAARRRTTRPLLATWFAVVAVVLGASAVWNHAPSVARATAAGALAPSSEGPTPTLSIAPSGYRAATTFPATRVVVLFPNENDFLSSSEIPIAGLAFGRPHGPATQSVHVELIVGGRVVDQLDLGVYTSRFSGTAHLGGTVVKRTTAEIRVSVPRYASNPPVVVPFIIEVPRPSN
jgi:hypothetical protein